MTNRSSWQLEDWSQWDRHYRGRFFNSLYGGRSVGLLCTQGAVWNAAPVSQILHVGAHPPQVGVLMRPDSENHQTRSNLTLQPWASLHFMPISDAERVHQASAAYGPEASELALLGWSHCPWTAYPVVALDDALLSLCLEVHEVLDLRNGTSLYVFDIREVTSNAQPDTLGHWPLSEKMLHSQGLEHYGHAVMPHGPLPYARP